MPSSVILSFILNDDLLRRHESFCYKLNIFITNVLKLLVIANKLFTLLRAILSRIEEYFHNYNAQIFQQSQCSSSIYWKCYS